MLVSFSSSFSFPFQNAAAYKRMCSKMQGNTVFADDTGKMLKTIVSKTRKKEIFQNTELL